MANKTFEELFAELQHKAAHGDPASSRTAELVDKGVHAIGKKVVEEAAELPGGLGRRREQAPQIAVGRLEFGAEFPGAGGEGPQRGGLFGLGAQHGLGVGDQPGGDGQGLVGRADEGVPAVDEGAQVVAAPGEGGAQLVDDGAQRGEVDGGGEVVDAGEQIGDGGGHPGVGPGDHRAVTEVGPAGAPGPQIDVLLADGGEVGDDRFEVGGDRRGGLLDAQLGLDTVVGEPQRADPAHGDTPVGDVGVGEKPAGALQLDPDDIVVADADVMAEVGVADPDEAEHQDGDDEEGEVLQPDGGGDHCCLPGVEDTAGSGRGVLARRSSGPAAVAGRGGVRAGMTSVPGAAASRRYAFR